MGNSSDVCFVHRDLESFHEFFESPDFRTDGLKLYPTLVIRGTGLYELWRTGRYKNYAPDRLVDLVARVLALVPPWVRVYRVQRDIPMPLVSLFLFTYVWAICMTSCFFFNRSPLGWRKEICGSSRWRGWVTWACGAGTCGRVRLAYRTYTVRSNLRRLSSCGGTIPPTGGGKLFYPTRLVYLYFHMGNSTNGVFCSQDPRQDILVGLLRLRRCGRTAGTTSPTLKGVRCSMVRELHVYGSAVAVHSRER